jgi:hypothetical protein
MSLSRTSSYSGAHSKRPLEPDLDTLLERAQNSKKRGNKDYWKHVNPVVDKEKKKVVYECTMCGKGLSVLNPHDSIGKHIVFTSEGVTCKGSQALDKAVRMAREGARGVDLARTGRVSVHQPQLACELRYIVYM